MKMKIKDGRRSQPKNGRVVVGVDCVMEGQDL
jgi:hypothetical protein